MHYRRRRKPPWSGDRLRHDGTSLEENIQPGEHDGPSDDRQKARPLGEHEPGRERCDDGLGQDGARDDGGLHMAKGPVVDRMTHKLRPSGDRRQPEPGLSGVTPETDVEAESDGRSYGRENNPTPCLILYQARAPLSLTNCPLRDHFLRHIGLLYTGSATASRPTLPKEATVLTQCKGSVTTRTSPMPLWCAISATLKADSQVLLAVSSRRIAASGTPIPRRMPDITTASPGGCSPSPPVGRRRSARPREYNSPACRVLAPSVVLGLPPERTCAPRT